MPRDRYSCCCLIRTLLWLALIFFLFPFFRSESFAQVLIDFLGS